MKRMNLLFVLLCGSILLLNACGGDDGGGSTPTGPAPIPNVSGNWFFAGNITSNTCRFLQGEPTFQLGASAVESLNVGQIGSGLTASVTGVGTIFTEDTFFTGTVTTTSFSLVASNPIVSSTGGSCTFALGGGTEVTMTGESTGSGSINLTLARIGGNCSVLEPLPCSVIWSGTWLRRTGAKSEYSEPAGEQSNVDRLLRSLDATTLK